MDYQPGPGVRPKKRARDRLIRLAQGHAGWAIGFEDETWWSGYAKPALHAWADEGKPLHLIEQPVVKGDNEAKALACYGILVRWSGIDGQSQEQVWLQFADGRPVSELTIGFLKWGCRRLKERGQEVLLLVWDNASWHISQRVRSWISDHNRLVKREGKGVRILRCQLPTKSPWLNSIEPCWVHAKRKVVEPAGLLSAEELMERIYAYFGCQSQEHLLIPKKAA